MLFPKCLSRSAEGKHKTIINGAKEHLPKSEGPTCTTGDVDRSDVPFLLLLASASMCFYDRREYWIDVLNGSMFS